MTAALGTDRSSSAAVTGPAAPGVQDLRAAWWYAVARASRGTTDADTGDDDPLGQGAACARAGFAPTAPPGRRLSAGQPRAHGQRGVLRDADVVTVLGATGGAGASTIALAVAEAAVRMRATRLIDPAPPTRSGLTCAPSRELGADGTGWLIGARATLQIDRRDLERSTHDSLNSGAPRPGDLEGDVGDGGAQGPAAGAARSGPGREGGPPAPRPPSPGQLVVIDQGTLQLDEWEAPARRAGRLVVVAAATPPSVRAARFLVGDRPGVLLVILSHDADPRRRRPLDRLVQSAGPCWAHVHTVRADPRLRRTGLTDAPLPAGISGAGAAIWDLLTTGSHTSFDTSGHPGDDTNDDADSDTRDVGRAAPPARGRRTRWRDLQGSLGRT